MKRSEDARHVAESELPATQGVVTWNTQALADSLERSKVLEEDLSQFQGAAQSVVREVLGPRPGSSVLVVDPIEIPSNVAGLISNGVFRGTSGVLTSMSSHHPNLDFAVMGRGYTTGWTTDQLREL